MPWKVSLHEYGVFFGYALLHLAASMVHGRLDGNVVASAWFLRILSRKSYYITEVHSTLLWISCKGIYVIFSSLCVRLSVFLSMHVLQSYSATRYKPNTHLNNA